MTALQLLPIVLSLLVLGAHFLRAGNIPLLVAVGLLLVLLAVRKRWVVRLVQVALILGALEWIRTLAHLADERLRAGEPFLRLALILGSVAAVTALSAWVFQTKTMGRAYGVRRRLAGVQQKGDADGGTPRPAP